MTTKPRQEKWTVAALGGVAVMLGGVVVGSVAVATLVGVRSRVKAAPAPAGLSDAYLTEASELFELGRLAERQHPG